LTLGADFDGGIIDKVNAKLYMRRTPDDPAAAPTYSAWQEFVNGTFIGRGFQFKAELTSAAIDQNIIIDELGYEATFQRRQEQSAGPTASGAGTLTVTFDKAFFTGTTTLGGAQHQQAEHWHRGSGHGQRRLLPRHQ
jgi:hypothetical protein